MGCHDELHVGEHADQLGKDLELVDGVKMQVDLVDDDHAAYVGGSGERGGAGRFEVSQDRQEQVEQRRLAAGQLREVGDDQSVVTVERDEPVAAPADPEARVGVVAEDAPDAFERGLEYTLVVVANFGSFPFDDPGLGIGPNRNRDAQASGLRHHPVVNDIE